MRNSPQITTAKTSHSFGASPCGWWLGGQDLMQHRGAPPAELWEAGPERLSRCSVVGLKAERGRFAKRSYSPTLASRGDSLTPHPQVVTYSCFHFSLGLEERERKAAVARLPGGSWLTSLCPTKVLAPCPSLQTLDRCPVIPAICQIQFFLGNFRDTSYLVKRLEFYSSYSVCSVTGHGP